MNHKHKVVQTSEAGPPIPSPDPGGPARQNDARATNPSLSVSTTSWPGSPRRGVRRPRRPRCRGLWKPGAHEAGAGH